MRNDAMLKPVLLLVIITLLISYSWSQRKDYRNDALEVTDNVRDFVVVHDISGTVLEKVHKIIELIHDRNLFIRIDRERIQSWITYPEKAEEFKRDLEWAIKGLEQLNKLRSIWPLSQEQSSRREELEELIFFGGHDLLVYENVIKKKNIYARDLPFAVSGSEAVEYGISDGCTTATKTFIVLAKAAGIEEIRFVGTGCTSDYNRACPTIGVNRDSNVTINGHWFALVRIQDRWALVNCTYFNSNSIYESGRYEILYELDGMPILPETLMLKVLRIPSFQREDICHNRLYVQCVGMDQNDDHDVENHEALMNMSVSGDRDCPICQYSQFQALFIRLR